MPVRVLTDLEGAFRVLGNEMKKANKWADSLNQDSSSCGTHKPGTFKPAEVESPLDEPFECGTKTGSVVFFTVLFELSCCD